MHCGRVLRNVFPELARHECMDDVRPIMWDLLIAKTPIELKRVAGAAMVREPNGNHGIAEIVGQARLSCGSEIWLSRYRRIRPRIQRITGSVAIIASHLNAAILWTNQIGLKVQVMIEPDLSGVRHVHGDRRKLRMRPVKARDRGCVVTHSTSRLELCVALRAAVVRSHRQSGSALVFQVARGAGGSEGLVRLVDRSVVASQARVIAHALGETASLAEMTQVALLREGGMRP